MSSYKQSIVMKKPASAALYTAPQTGSILRNTRMGQRFYIITKRQGQYVTIRTLGYIDDGVLSLTEHPRQFHGVIDKYQVLIASPNSKQVYQHVELHPQDDIKIGDLSNE